MARCTFPRVCTRRAESKEEREWLCYHIKRVTVWPDCNHVQRAVTLLYLVTPGHTETRLMCESKRYVDTDEVEIWTAKDHTLPAGVTGPINDADLQHVHSKNKLTNCLRVMRESVEQVERASRESSGQTTCVYQPNEYQRRREQAAQPTIQNRQQIYNNFERKWSPYD